MPKALRADTTVAPEVQEKRDQIDRVTLWGVHDGMSWKNGYPIPGRTNYPLLFDRDRRPKPAYDAVLAVPQRTQ